MLSKEATKCQKKKSVGLISKKTTLHVQHTFLYISLPFFCKTTTRNFQKHPSYTFYVFLSTFFFAAAHFHLGGRQHFPMFLTATIKFSYFSFNEIGLLCFFSRSSSFSVIHVNVDIKIKSKERVGFVIVVFISKSPGSFAIYRRNAQVLEMQNFIPAYMKGWTYGRFPQNQNFLDVQVTKFSYPWCSVARECARESSAIKFTILYVPQIAIMLIQAGQILNKGGIKLHKKKGKEKKYNKIQKETPYM